MLVLFSFSFYLSILLLHLSPLTTSFSSYDLSLLLLYLLLVVSPATSPSHQSQSNPSLPFESFSSIELYSSFDSFSSVKSFPSVKSLSSLELFSSFYLTLYLHLPQFRSRFLADSLVP